MTSLSLHHLQLYSIIGLVAIGSSLAYTHSNNRKYSSARTKCDLVNCSSGPCKIRFLTNSPEYYKCVKDSESGNWHYDQHSVVFVVASVVFAVMFILPGIYLCRKFSSKTSDPKPPDNLVSDPSTVQNAAICSSDAGFDHEDEETFQQPNLPEVTQEPTQVDGKESFQFIDILPEYHSPPSYQLSVIMDERWSKRNSI